jgi:hypothetical protein
LYEETEINRYHAAHDILKPLDSLTPAEQGCVLAQVYPAAHGSLSGAISATLAYLFPHDAIALNALGDEAGESRLWAGIHFRSDINTGLALGRAVA